MRVFSLGLFWMMVAIVPVIAQRDCYSVEYALEGIKKTPGLMTKVAEMESVIRQQKLVQLVQGYQRGEGIAQLKIPVVVHILYNSPTENISDADVHVQIAALNQAFRRNGADTVNTPSAFKSLAADCEIEFQLAISDPMRRGTTGIIRKYTPVSRWSADDNMKYSSQTGDDAWDARQYLNIWVCNLRLISGYSSIPGDDAAKDGIVLSFAAFAKAGGNGFGLGKTGVHEVGHWLGLKHIWGDSYCGDDGIDDTPTQGNFTSGCPTGVRNSCGNGVAGDMYMNYMDLTTDECTNMFTHGQKQRMWTLFNAGGVRQSLINSKGLQPPLINEIPLPEESLKWLYPHLYPNPASTEILLDISYDIRWVGKIIYITNTNGQQMMQTVIGSKVQKVDISRLTPGVYFLFARKEDGTTIKEKFVKR